MKEIFEFVVAHWGVIAVVCAMVATAVTVTMPETRPTTADDWYAWLRDAVHQFANMRDARRPQVPPAE